MRSVDPAKQTETNKPFTNSWGSSNSEGIFGDIRELLKAYCQFLFRCEHSIALFLKEVPAIF